jgi:SAM-dependent methyltransferase
VPTLLDVEHFLRQVVVVSDEIDDRILVDKPIELDEYIHVHAYRLWRSLEIIDSQINLSHPLKILELGSMPYYFSALLRQFLPNAEITGINVKSNAWGTLQSSTSEALKVSLQFGQAGPIKNFEIYLMNIERDRFPFEEGTFDLVLCMEVIEHLTYSPTHMLVESHRVLKDDGLLFLSTPNAVDLRKTLLQVLNRPVGFPYSGYGVYGRHNREYTLKELQGLVEACGFSTSRSWSENIYSRRDDPFQKRLLYGIHNLITSIPLPYLRNKRQYCYLLARAVGEPIYALPKALYLFRELYPGK